jgi:glycosyltransferase involved in cell wall biosynthesis
VLLEAVAELAKARPEVRLVVAGDGPDRAKLEARAKRLGLAPRVEFRGYQSQAQVRELLRHTDVFAMASFAEGVPVVLMEAMAAGVPVIATRIAGVPELVEDGANGYLVSPGEPTAIARKAALLLDDAELRNRLGAAGRAKVEREFNITTEARRLCRIMTSALGARVVAQDTTAEAAAAPAGEVVGPPAPASQAAAPSDGTWSAPAPMGA